MKKSKMLIIASGLALVLWACGDGEEAQQPAETTTDQSPTTSGSAEDVTETNAASDPAGSAQAIVTIGDAQWDFQALEGYDTICLTADDGAIDVRGVNADSTIALVGTVQPNSWVPGTKSFEPHGFTINDSVTFEEWVAGYGPASLTYPDSGILEWTLDGGFAEGTASFIRTDDLKDPNEDGYTPPVPVQGTFEITCGG